jgi:hypothetical protein
MKRISTCIILAAAIAASRPSQALPLGFGIGLRLGGATSNASGLLVGVDATVPTISFLHGFKTRVDFDTWGQPMSGWDRSTGGTAATVCQVVDGLIGYYGFGVGYSRLRLHGDAYEGPEAKLLSGLNVLGLGLEVNLHIGKIRAWTGMARFRF